MRAARSGTAPARLSVATKLVYGLGDHTVNLVLSAASLLYLAFLTEIAGLRPALAGLVILIARWVDAITDPLMGRLSDLTRWRLGRRRGYFLIGAVPFGLSFALMWASPPLASETARFAYYSGIYVLVSCAMTCLSVPYLALLPEMASGYDERTSLNTYRSMAAVLGTLVAAGMKAVTDSLGGGAAAWQTAALIFGVWIALPWFAVFRVSFERPTYSRPVGVGFLGGARQLLRHSNYRTLVGFFLLARIAVDMIAAMFLLYFRHWIGREQDFTTTLFLFLSVVIASQPLWLWVARRTDKRTAFLAGTLWWIVFEIVIFLAQPDWPRSSLYAITALAAVGYAVADLMPWAMLGEVIDEDELATGERREGLYVGFFTFLRKLGGSAAVAAVAFTLDLCGFTGGVPREQQPALALSAIRVLTSLAPALLLLLAVAVARGYPLDRVAHARILDAIASRAAARSGGKAGVD
jgi:GPH family glycoside/pentoside/hexuronide:cation symporter